MDLESPNSFLEQLLGLSKFFITIGVDFGPILRAALDARKTVGRAHFL